jgi:hypothetical protein
MSSSRIRLYAAGLLAFLIGMPLTERAFAQVGDIVNGAIGLGLGIADSAGGS